MNHKITIKIPSGDVKIAKEFLDSGGDEKNGEVIKTYTADFGGGLEVDIKIVDADTPYIDAVMFEAGHEIAVLEPSDNLVGEYIFNVKEYENGRVETGKDVTYTVVVESGTPDECPKCGRECGWYARIQNRGDCMTDQQGNWVKDMEVDDSEIYGPYQCQECGHGIGKLPNGKE